MATIKNSPLPGKLPSSRGIAVQRTFRPLLGLLLLTIVAAASVAGTWFFMNWKQSRDTNPVQLGVGQPSRQPVTASFTEAPAAPAAVPSPIFIALEPFTVTVEGAQSERVLHAGITLRVGEEQSRIRIEKYMPEVRSRILMLLSAQTPESLRTAEGRNAIAEAVAREVNKPFSPLPDGQYVTDVLFTEFVVQ
ncbi:flagellar basal body-associated FliL family protein [Bordetella sp. 2513F-2]